MLLNRLSLLKPGAVAPPFRLLDHRGHCVALDDYRDTRGVVLLFFSSDWLQQDLCLLESFMKAYPQLREAGLEVLALSGINWETLHHFAKRVQCPFPLVFDPCCRFSKKYGAMLIPKFVTGRAVYAVDPQGTIVFAQKSATPQAVLAAFTG